MTTETRYEQDRSDGLVHMDVKKLERIRRRRKACRRPQRASTSASSPVVVPAGYHHHRRRSAGRLAQAPPQSSRYRVPSDHGDRFELAGITALRHRSTWSPPSLRAHPTPRGNLPDTRPHRSLFQLVRSTGNPGRSVVGAWFHRSVSMARGHTGCLDEQRGYQVMDPPPGLASGSVSTDRFDPIPRAPHLVDEAQHPRL